MVPGRQLCCTTSLALRQPIYRPLHAQIGSITRREAGWLLKIGRARAWMLQQSGSWRLGVERVSSPAIPIHGTAGGSTAQLRTVTVHKCLA
jgi:hypothetical protein